MATYVSLLEQFGEEVCFECECLRLLGFHFIPPRKIVLWFHRSFLPPFSLYESFSSFYYYWRFFSSSFVDPRGTSLLLLGPYEQRFDVGKRNLYVQKDHVAIISNVYVTALVCLSIYWYISWDDNFFFPQIHYSCFSHFSHFSRFPHFQRTLCYALCSTMLYGL